MFFDSVEISTGTYDCNIGWLSHYQITVNFPNRIACVASAITIHGQGSGYLQVAPQARTLLNLSTSIGKGIWASILMGNGNPQDIGATVRNVEEHSS